MYLKQKIPLALLEKKNMNAIYEKYFSGHITLVLWKWLAKEAQTVKKN